MTPFTTLESTAVVLPLDDVDTDQIIPARFLRAPTRPGSASTCSPTARRHPRLPAARDRRAVAQILVAGANFGCGSSREHAPWALVDRGFRAIIARSFADIFRQNATKNGLLPIALDGAAYGRVVVAQAADPRAGSASTCRRSRSRSSASPARRSASRSTRSSSTAW